MSPELVSRFYTDKEFTKIFKKFSFSKIVQKAKDLASQQVLIWPARKLLTLCKHRESADMLSAKESIDVIMK